MSLHCSSFPWHVAQFRSSLPIYLGHPEAKRSPTRSRWQRLIEAVVDLLLPQSSSLGRTGSTSIATMISEMAKSALPALWFAVFGLASVTVLFHRLPMTTRGSLVYIVLPTVASAVAGGLWGRAIIDEAKTNSIRQSLLRGIFVGMSAFLIFSLLFALALPFVERGWSLRQSGGLFLLASTLGFLTALPIVLVGGMFAGATLYLCGRRFR